MPTRRRSARSSTLSDSATEDNSEYGAIDEEARELEKKARALDAARKSYMEDSQKIINKQQDAIERLKKENSSLKEELNSQLKVESAEPTTSQHGRIVQLKELVESYVHKVELEQRKIEEQAKDTEVYEAKVLHLRKLVGGASGAQDNSKQLQRMCSMLENRLETAQVKYNQLLSKNRRLREEIESMRKERITFENIYRKMEAELQHKKGELSAKIEASNTAYEARDQALAEAAALTAKADGEQSEFEIEMARLAARAGLGRGSGGSSARNLLYSSVTSLRHSKESEPGGTGETVASFEEAFEKLKAAPGGEGQPKDVVASFVAKEDANLALFHRVRELKQEVKRLEETKAEKQAEMERVRRQGVLCSDSGPRSELVQSLRAELEQLKDRAIGIQGKNEDTVKAVEAVQSEVRRMAQELKAALPPAGADAEAGEEAAEGSVLQALLGAFEQRINEAATMWSAYQASRTGGGWRQGSTASSSCLTRSASEKVRVIAPTISQEDDNTASGSSDEERPLTREQLKSKMARDSGSAYEEFLCEKGSPSAVSGSTASNRQDKRQPRRAPSSAVHPRRNASSAGAKLRVASARGPLTRREQPAGPVAEHPDASRTQHAKPTGAWK
mmetsp:Transcript_1832/g.4318  ORF Transcript_1832/g.4318 Transcript_1832/m.4318 type:complete len:619 (+) Transcript_1832:212-2068(+)